MFLIYKLYKVSYEKASERERESGRTDEYEIIIKERGREGGERKGGGG